MNENIKSLILKICEIALDKNRRNKNTVFINFFGHVNSLEVLVYKKGWVYEGEQDYKKDLYLDLILEKDTEKELKEIIDYLEDLEEDLED